MDALQQFETWKDILEYEDRYQVSDFGNVRIKYGNLLTHHIDKDGYHSVTLTKKKKQ